MSVASVSKVYTGPGVAKGDVLSLPRSTLGRKGALRGRREPGLEHAVVGRGPLRVVRA